MEPERQEELLQLPLEETLQPPTDLQPGEVVVWHPELSWRLFEGQGLVLQVYESGVLRVHLRVDTGFVDVPAKFVLRNCATV